MKKPQKVFYSEESQKWVYKCPTCKKEVATDVCWYEPETQTQKHFACLKKNKKK